MSQSEGELMVSFKNPSKQFNLPEDKQEFYCYTSQYKIQSFYTAQAQLKNIFELLDSLQYNQILLDEYINCLGIAFETDQAKIRHYMKQIKFLENTGKGRKIENFEKFGNFDQFEHSF